MKFIDFVFAILGLHDYRQAAIHREQLKQAEKRLNNCAFRQACGFDLFR